MCHFLSFVITKDERILVGDLSSHEGIEAGWNLKPGEYFEGEWLEDDSGRTLTVRGDDGNWWKVIVLRKYPTRKSLLKSIVIGKRGKNKYWYRDGGLHCEDGPAIIYINGTKHWYKDGKLHREDGPAVKFDSGEERWYKDGKLHREDGPAVMFVSGEEQWWVGGKLHREDGPAIENFNGTKHWYKNGKLHREDGPAIECAEGKYWYKNGKFIKRKRNET